MARTDHTVFQHCERLIWLFRMDFYVENSMVSKLHFNNLIRNFLEPQFYHQFLIQKTYLEVGSKIFTGEILIAFF